MGKNIVDAPKQGCHYKGVSIRDLAFLALPRRIRERGLIALVTAYLDESGTHAGSAVTVMGGFVGTVAQWELFESAWDKLMARHPEFDGRPVHTTDLMRRDGAFAGWSDTKQSEFVVEICRIVADAGVYGVVASLDTRAFDQHREDVKGVRLNLDTAYGKCFRHVMVDTCKYVRNVYPGESVSFVVEDGHTNCGDAFRIFNATKKGDEILCSFTSAGKRSCGALQAADLISYCVHKHFESCMADPATAPLLPKYVASTADRLTFLDHRYATMQTLHVLAFAEESGRTKRAT